MNIYGRIGTYEMVVDEAGSGCPDGFIEMVSQRPDGEDTLDYTAQLNGTWAITQDTRDDKQSVIETEWRATELAVIFRQLEAIEEDEAGETPADLLPGTRKQWLGHRGRVTAWVANDPDFPDSSKRPVAPT
ncbi:hypothetical protein ACI77F_26050 [Pseudomonas tritici]|uniref:hypothetical protein n=1 Tax=Pseudomonas tritici TaxID=2745518 RepID=UPI00387B8B52